MCLDLLQDIQLRKKDNKFYGYKYFAVRKSGKLSGMAYNGRTLYPINKWILDNSQYSLRCDNQRTSYKTGFHIYLNNKSLKNGIDAVVRKVEFKSITATGKQFKRNVVVAREMKILP